MPERVETTVRPLVSGDLAAIVRLDAVLTGASKDLYWQQVLGRHLEDAECIGLAAAVGEELDGYLFGELRAFEFGSERCGWIFALGVQPDTTRQGVASALLAAAGCQFRSLGVSRVRTMVNRTDVPMLALFRSQAFVGGPFVQLELDMTENSTSPVRGE